MYVYGYTYINISIIVVQSATLYGYINSKHPARALIMAMI